MVEFFEVGIVKWCVDGDDYVIGVFEVVRVDEDVVGYNCVEVV